MQIAFRPPFPERFHLSPSFDSIEMVDHIKSLGVIIQHKLNFELHMSSLLKQCSQRMYLLRLLRSQGLSANHLHTVFHAIVVSRILYALPAWECSLMPVADTEGGQGAMASLQTHVR